MTMTYNDRTPSMSRSRCTQTSEAYLCYIEILRSRSQISDPCVSRLCVIGMSKDLYSLPALEDRSVACGPETEPRLQSITSLYR